MAGSPQGGSLRRTAWPSTGTGNIHVGELSGRTWPRFSKDPQPKRLRVIHKLIKTTA
jgi:hypothetical protein